MTGCRDTDENIEKTAQDLANAISSLMETEKPVVQKAYEKLAQIISRNYENATMEAGQYIVRTFYGGETDIEKDPYDENFNYTPESIENARNKKSPIESSLRQLYAEINGDKESTTPSQAWIYNAVNLVVQWQDMKTELKENFYTYRNLLLSHKRALLQVKNIEEKKAFIQELQKQELSVRDLKKQIAERKKQPDKETSIYSLITNPEELLSGKYSKLLSLEELKKIKVDTHIEQVLFDKK